VWSITFIASSEVLPITLQYVMLLVIIMISAISLAVMVVIREYFLAFVFAALWPIAWWSLVHLWDQPHNLVLGLLLLAVTGLLVAASNGIHDTFRRMLSLSWQQEAMARELGQITNSLRDRNRQLQEARRQLTDLANIDELTGLGNRRMINSALREEVNRARRAGGWVSVILIDVDYFKKYNDSYGHPAGDEVLRRIGDIMQRSVGRAGEVVGRYGGEEFILVLPGAMLPDAMRTAERLKRLIHEENIPHKSSNVADRVSISQGVLSVMPNEDVDPGVLVDRADAALYQAKREGRNSIAVASERNPTNHI
jgi:diguanylate cyclase (GGDEF)-like protein